MSIYVVKLQEWYPKPSRFHKEADRLYYEMARLDVDLSKCLSCKKRLKWNRAVGHHSIPWGYGDIWCGWKCYEGD